MIAETRQLVFSNSALRKAFAWYQTAKQSDLPHGVIASVTPRPDGSVTLMLQQSGASRLREIAFSPSRTMGVLLYFCRKQRIPIPREADKDIDGVDDSLVLTIDNRFHVNGP